MRVGASAGGLSTAESLPLGSSGMTDGMPVRVPRGTLPSMHSFRHTVASGALLAGESIDEVAFLLGHRDGTVTRAVYVPEVADARRRALRRSRMASEFAGALRVALDSEHGQE
jgi:integrase